MKALVGGKWQNWNFGVQYSHLLLLISLLYQSPRDIILLFYIEDSVVLYVLDHFTA